MAIWRDLLKFYRAGFVPNELKHVIYPIGWGVRVGSWIADPDSCLDGTGEFAWAPGDAGRDGVQASYNVIILNT